MPKNVLSFVLITFLLISLSDQLSVSDLKVKKLKAGNFIRLGESEKVYFSWKIALNGIETKARDVVQEAYEVNINLYGELVFSSGRIESSQTTYVYFDSFSPKNSQEYTWSVKVWSNASPDPIQSQESNFYTDIAVTEWEKTSWVSGGNLYRTIFHLSNEEIEDIRNGFLFISGLGYNIPYINGFRPLSNDRFLDPSWTNYNKSVLYTAYEITYMLHEGENVLGVMLGNGWYVNNDYYGTDVELCVMSVVQVQKMDGTIRSFYSQPSDWNTTSDGPIVFDSVYDGESYDARKFEKGWNDVGFVLTEHWKQAKATPSPPTGEMKLQQRPPIMISEKFTPIGEFETDRGTYIYDFGQNFAGVCEWSISVCPAGGRLAVRHAEILTVDGKHLYVENLRGAKATDYYVCSGFQDRYRPSFTSHGFRYIEVIGLTPEMKDGFSVTGLHFHTSVPVVGKLKFDVELYNKLQSNIVYGQQSNLMSIPTDCPQRDEVS